MISGPFQAIFFTVITCNPESNCTCRKKSHFLFRWNVSMLPEILIHHWMQCWRKTFMITETWMEIVNCQIRGPDSQDLPYWMKNHRMDIHGPGGDWQENKRPPCQTLCGQRFGKICPMRRNAKKSKSGLLGNLSSTVPKDCVVFISLIPRMRNSTISWKMRLESWRFRCQQQCLVKIQYVKAARKPPSCRIYEDPIGRSSLQVSWRSHGSKRDEFTKSLQFGAQIHSYASNKWKYQMQRLQWKKNGKHWKRYQHGNWRKSETKMRWVPKQGIKAEPYTLHRWWTSVISRIRSWSHSFENNTKAESYSEVTMWRMIQDRIQCSLSEDHQHHRYLFKTTGMRRASSRRSILLHPGQKCTNVIQKFPKSECPDIWIRLPRHKSPKSLSSIEDPVVPLERNLYGHPLAGLSWERQFEKVLLESTVGKSPKLGRLIR